MVLARKAAGDVAICARPSQDPAIAHRSLGTPPAVLCATPAYLERRGTPMKPEDLRSHDLLTPDTAERPEFRLLLSRGTQRAEIAVSPKLAVADPAVLHAAAAAGLGIGLLPGFLCRQGLATGRLKTVLAGLDRTARRRSPRPLSRSPGGRYACAALCRLPGRECGAGAGLALILPAGRQVTGQ